MKVAIGSDNHKLCQIYLRFSAVLNNLSEQAGYCYRRLPNAESLLNSLEVPPTNPFISRENRVGLYSLAVTSCTTEPLCSPMNCVGIEEDQPRSHSGLLGYDLCLHQLSSSCRRSI